MGKPDAPQPINPFLAASAQTGSNVSTAVANAYLGNVNQNTPTGSLSYAPTGSYQWGDPTTGSVYNIPTFTATQTYTPAQQNIQNLNEATQTQLANTALSQAGKLQTHLGGGVNVAGAPAGGIAAALANAQMAQGAIGNAANIASSFGDAGNISQQIAGAGPIGQQFGQAGDVTRTYGDFASERNRIEQGLMDRLNPSLSQERSRYEQQLADQGIRYGSPAYENAMRNYSMQANDARLAAIGQAGQEQQRMANMANQLAGFENQAQQQAYQQALGRGTFANQAQQQQFTQNAAQSDFYNRAQQQLFEQLYGRGQFANAAQQQDFGQQAARASFVNTAQAQNFQQQQAAFNASQAARSQYWNEQFALRNQPLNEIIALMSGSQVQQPNFVGANMPTIPTTDIAGLMNANFNQQMDVFKQNSANTNQLIGGILGAGSSLGSAFIRSDRDVKENIERMGTVFADNAQGDTKSLPVYQYSYKDDPSEQRHVGPMAQDVEKIDKRAVRKFDGVRHIDLPKLGSILKAA